MPDEYEGLPTTDSSGTEIPGTGRLDGGDCDDEDADVNPGADDEWYDGVDSDCGQDDDYDADEDGYVPEEYEGEPTYSPNGDLVDGTGDADGGDCNDADAANNPGGDETWYDGVDSDCAGDDDYDQDADGHVPEEYEGEPTYSGDGGDDQIPGTGDLPADDCDDTDPAVLECAAEVPYYKGGGGCGCATTGDEPAQMAGLAGVLAAMAGFWRRRRSS